MTTERDLINAVRDSMESNGQLGHMKAEMRTEIMKLLDQSNKSQKNKCPKLPHNVLILNELIREYMDWIGYKYSSTVFTAECNLSKQPLDKSFILHDLGIKDTEETRSVPLLFNLLNNYKRENNR